MCAKKTISHLSSGLFTLFLILALTFSTLGVRPAHATGIRLALPAGAGDCSNGTIACDPKTALAGMPNSNETRSAANLPMYADALDSSWEDWSWDTTRDFNNKTPIHSGSASIAVTYTANWGGLYLHADPPIPAEDYSAVRFWVHGGSTGGQPVKLYVNDGAEYYNFTVPANAWSEVTVPLAALGDPATLSAVVWQDYAGGIQPTFYLDDISLVGVRHRYAKPGATGDCSGWASACDLQTALTGALSGDEIWAAAGIYRPTTNPTDRYATFQLKDNVALYGGFSGTETARSQRNPTTNVTILSGDIDENDSQTPIITDLTTVTGNIENSYTVVTGASGAILDGFTITAGYNFNQGFGGGMYNDHSNPVLANLTFSGNLARGDGYGGGIYNDSSNPTLKDVIFNANSVIYLSGHSSGNCGGGMYNLNSNPTLINVTFNNNTATNENHAGTAGLGGGMCNDHSNPKLTTVTFDGNFATGSGGGIYNSNSLPILTDVTFSNNSAINYAYGGVGGGGGGMYNDASSNPVLTNVSFISNTVGDKGGGMDNSSSNPSLTNVTFTGNSAAYGGGMHNANSNPTLSTVVFISNNAGFGGGIYNFSSNPTLTDVTFNDNTGSNAGGGIYDNESTPILTGVTFNKNQASGGGGIFNNYSNPSLTNVTFSKNTAVTGGGMENDWEYNDTGSPNLTGVAFDDNTATVSGGGMFNHYSSPSLTNITFSSNSAPKGGGIFIDHSSLSLTNVTFNGNSATIYGGGIYNSSSSPTVKNVTLANNSADQGGGMYAYSGSPNIRNTIFWGNSATSGGDQIFNYSFTNPNIGSSVVQGGCPAGSTCGSIITADPKLGALGNHGGSTQTIPLLAKSSAIDTGNDSVCPANDQRGVARSQGAHCDIGAYEYQDTTPPTVDTFTATTPTNLNIPITAFSATDDTTVTGYLITESATAPAANDPVWTSIAPTTYTVSSGGSYTLYPWAKDASGNVSAEFESPLQSL